MIFFLLNVCKGSTIILMKKFGIKEAGLKQPLLGNRMKLYNGNKVRGSNSYLLGYGL
jgi:hypothetical protein